MNAVEIEEAISALAEQPFDPAEFPFAFLQAFGNKETTILRSATVQPFRRPMRQPARGFLPAQRRIMTRPLSSALQSRDGRLRKQAWADLGTRRWRRLQGP